MLGFYQTAHFPLITHQKSLPSISMLDSFITTIFIANWPIEPIQYIAPPPPPFFFSFDHSPFPPCACVSLTTPISSYPISSLCWIACSRTSNFNLNRRWSIRLANCPWQHQQFESKGFIGNLKGILIHSHNVAYTYCLLCQLQLSCLNKRSKSFFSTLKLWNCTQQLL